MLILWLHIVLLLIVILIAAELFTNSLEHFGERIGISAGVTGSIFAAIATAMPEMSIPIIALVAGTPDKLINEEVSVGAILGAPLMLSTLSIFVMALFVMRRRGMRGVIKPEKSGLKRDVNFFLCAFFLAAIAMYLPTEPFYLRTSISFVLIGIYVSYIVQTCMASKSLVAKGHGVESDEPLLLTKLYFKNNFFTIILQLCLGFVLLIISAKKFIGNIHEISGTLHVSALLLSLLIIPIATELPEKVNSIFWLRKNKDTLGFGNITGSMLLQGTLLPALGIMLTPWQPNKIVLAGIVITLLAAAWLRYHATDKGIPIKALMVNGGLYLVYLIWVFS